MHKFSQIFFLAGWVLLLSACGVSRKATIESSDPENSGNLSSEEVENILDSKELLIETGVASWYGPDFDGKLTANGEIYDMHGISAAHRTLPFNSMVLVENLDNGKTLQVRINDRGPYAKDRIIDLSRGAAEKLGVIGPGTANVKLYWLNGKLDDTRISNLKVPTYTIQLGSYAKRQQAKTQSDKIRESRIEVFERGSETIYRVYYGKYTDPGKAQKDLKRLRNKGFTGFVKQIEND